MKRLDISRIYRDYAKISKDDADKTFLGDIGKLVQETYLGGKAYLDLQSRIWDENIHFYEGDQYLYYNDILGQYQNRPVTKFNRFMPRSVTNYIFPITNTMVSLLTKQKPDAKVTPNSTQQEDKNRARLADAVLKSKWETDEEHLKHTIAAKLGILTGTVYRKDYWDITGLGEVEIPGDKKTIKGSRIAIGIAKEKEEHPELPEEELRQLVIDHLKEDPSCYGSEDEETPHVETEAEEGEESKEHEEKEGKEVESKEHKVKEADLEYQEDNTKLPLGDSKVRMLSVFEILPDLQNAIHSIDDGEFIMECTMHPVSWIKETYDQDKPGYTGLAKDVTEDKSMSLQLTYLERLKGSTGKSGQYGIEPDTKDQAVLIECYVKPTKEYKKGLLVVVANSKVLYINSSPYTYGEGINWHPYTMFRWDLHPLRHHGISLTEQQVPIQKKYNAIDNLIILNRMTNSTPQWLIPIGCMTPGGYISGEPGLNIPYNPAIGTPSKIPGMALDASVWKEREEARQDLHLLAGDNEVLQGLRPQGVNTASGLNMLIEQSYSKFSPVVQAWEKFIEQGQTKKLNLIRRFYKEPRPELIKRIKAMNSDLTEAVIDDYFTGESLGDNLDVQVEAGSSLPRSTVAHQNNLKELAALPQNVLGALDPMTNPLGNKAFLKEFGINDFPTPTGNDTEKADWENTLMRQGKFEDVEVLPFDNPVIHYNVVCEELKRPEFWLDNKEEVIAHYIVHAVTHYLDMSPDQVQMAGISPIQEQEVINMGMQFISYLDPLHGQELQNRFDAMNHPMQVPPPQPQVTAGQEPVENLSPVTSPAGANPGSDLLLQTSPEVALNTQGGQI